MQPIQKQIMQLNYRLDRLYQIVESMKTQEKFSDFTLNELEMTVEDSYFNSNLMKNISNNQNNTNVSINENNLITDDFSLINGHKDIIEDNDFKRSHDTPIHLENDMSCEIQLQRLTAQLTAAYNRIASLEEQLLSQRNSYSQQ
jgi:hypothetical protein